MDDASPVDIFVSLAAFRHASLIEAVVRNVLTYTEPKRLALHISLGSWPASSAKSTFATRLTRGKQLFLRLSQQSRIVLNPKRFAVGRHGPELLAVHLSNVKLLDQLGVGARPAGRDRILLLPGNAVLFRPCTPLLRQAPMSFAPGQFSDVALRPATPDANPLAVHAELPLPECTSAALTRRFGIHNHKRHPPSLADLRWKPFWSPPPSTTWDVFMRAMRKGDDELMRRPVQCEADHRSGHFWRGFFEWAGRSNVKDMHDDQTPPVQWAGKPPPDFFARKPLAHTIHEGSWYPATVLRAAIAAFADGPLSVPNLTRGCQHRALCALEEHALPTFAWQRYPRLVAHARPPVVARVMDYGVARDACVHSPCTRACRENAQTFPALMDAVAGRPDLWCALKITKDGEHEATTEHLIREVERCGGLCGCPTANESTPNGNAAPTANESTPNESAAPSPTANESHASSTGFLGEHAILEVV